MDKEGRGAGMLPIINPEGIPFIIVFIPDICILPWIRPFEPVRSKIVTDPFRDVA